jgi:hypothetical protein
MVASGLEFWVSDCSNDRILGRTFVNGLMMARETYGSNIIKVGLSLL